MDVEDPVDAVRRVRAGLDDGGLGTEPEDGERRGHVEVAGQGGVLVAASPGQAEHLTWEQERRAAERVAVEDSLS